MRILLTGATGFIGFATAHQLCKEGVTARLMARRPLRGAVLAGLSSAGAEFVQADLTSPKSLERAAADCDAVIHLAGRATFESYRIVAPTILRGARAVMEAAAGAGVRTVVFASSLLVYGGGQGPVDAATPASPALGYGHAKLEAEALLADIAGKNNMNLAVFRVPHTYGAMDLLFHNIRRGRTISPGWGKNPFGRLHVTDCARLLVAAAKQGWSGTSPVADEHSCSWNEFFDVVRTYYPRLTELKVPAPLACVGAWGLERMARLAGRPTIQTVDAVRGWNLDIPVKPGLVWNELGLAPSFPTVHEGVPAVLDDCVAFRWAHPLRDHCG